MGRWWAQRNERKPTTDWRRERLKEASARGLVATLGLLWGLDDAHAFAVPPREPGPDGQPGEGWTVVIDPTPPGAAPPGGLHALVEVATLGEAKPYLAGLMHRPAYAKEIKDVPVTRALMADAWGALEQSTRPGARTRGGTR